MRTEPKIDRYDAFARAFGDALVAFGVNVQIWNREQEHPHGLRDGSSGTLSA